MNLGFTEMMFLFLLALLIFGPKKLPEIGKQIGRGLSEFRRASNDFRNQLETEVEQLKHLEMEDSKPPAATPSAPAGTVAAGSPPKELPYGSEPPVSPVPSQEPAAQDADKPHA